MPQMAPSNWMFILVILIFLILFIKTNLQTTSFSTQTKKIHLNNKKPMKW